MMFTSLRLFVFFSILAACCQLSSAKTSIAVVTSDKIQTRLRLIRDSPKTLVSRLNSQFKGAKSEDIARAPVTTSEWIALDYDIRRNEYFAIDRLSTNIVIILDVYGYTDKTSVLFGGISPKVNAIAYDWLRRYLYWADPSYQAIFRLSIGQLCGDGSCKPPFPRPPKLGSRPSLSRNDVLTSIIGSELTDPCSVLVDPMNGHLYWADDGAVPSIERSTLDGRNRTFIIRGLIRPAALTLDYKNNRLYWLERLSGLSVINSCELSKVVCLQNRVSTVRQSHMYDMDFHEGFLISSDLAVNRLVIYDTNTGQLLRQNWAGTTYGVCVATRDRQPWKEISNFYEGTSNFNNITEHGIVLLAAKKSGILLIEKTFAMGRDLPIARPLVQEKGITSLAMDVKRNTLFYFSRLKKSIFKISLPDNILRYRNPLKTDVVSSWIQSVSAMAVDWSTGNLYWLDTGYRRLMVSRANGSFANVIHHENIVRPQDLVIHSGKRLMFWSDTDERYPRIERSDLDGSNRKIIIKKNVFYERPHALAIDFQQNVLYWSDGQFLCRSTFNGTLLEDCKRRDFTSKASVRSMDIAHDYILWTDYIGGLKSADMDNGFPLTQDNTPVYYRKIAVNDILYWHASRQTIEIDPCGPSPSCRVQDENMRNTSVSSVSPVGTVVERGGSCSQLCLATSYDKQCACAVGYWLKSSGDCTPGIILNDYIVFCDLKTGRLFRQFTLLPDYYALPLAGDTHAIDVAVDQYEEKVYWLDSQNNMVHAEGLSGGQQPYVVFAAGNVFTMTKLELAPITGLLYIVTITGDVVLMSVTSGFFDFVVKDTNWIVHSLAVDEENRQIYMTATRRSVKFRRDNKTVQTSTGVILRADMDGANLVELLVSKGRPLGIATYKGSIVWTDVKLQAVYSTSVQMDRTTADQTSDSERVVVTLAHMDTYASPEDVIVHDDVVYFVDRSKQAVQRFPLHGPAQVTSVGFPFMNDISGLNYFGERGMGQMVKNESCTGIWVPKSDNTSQCRCQFHGDVITTGAVSQQCQSVSAYLHIQSKKYGICLIKPQVYASVRGGLVGSYVLSGQRILVTCDPGYRLSNSWLGTETRTCSNAEWTSKATCVSALTYTVQGNSNRGYVILLDSTTFVVPRNVTEVEVICIGGGGGGYDGCDKNLRTTKARAGMGGSSKFGKYLRAYGGQGGSFHEGGRGGRGRTLFGGDGKLSSQCLGGGAAGETSPPKVCRLGRTSCPFCGAGGAMPSCSRCHIRSGGCGGLGSENALEPGGADHFGGGATGTFGGGSGGGGGYSRKTISVSPMEEIKVKVGKMGWPSAKPAGDGVVVVAWGDRIENLISVRKQNTICKPFTYKLDDENATDFLQRCFS